MGLPLLPSTPFSIEMPKLYMRQLLPLDIRHYFKKIDWTVCIATNGSHPKGQMTARSGAAGENSLPSHRREKMHLFNDRTYTCQENPPKNGENLAYFGTLNLPLKLVYGMTISDLWDTLHMSEVVLSRITRVILDLNALNRTSYLTTSHDLWQFDFWKCWIKEKVFQKNW